MNRRPNAPMPDSIRHFMRAGQHPARAVECPHCGVRAHRPCRVQSSGRQLPQPHPARITVWARVSACCPECQVEPGIPCHRDGARLLGDTIHARRYQEAEATVA